MSSLVYRWLARVRSGVASILTRQSESDGDPKGDSAFSGLNESIRSMMEVQTSTTADSGLERMVARFVRELMPRAAERCGLSPRGLAERIQQVGVTQKLEVNALTVSEENGNFSIYVNIGLLMFLHKMTKLFATRFGLMDDPGRLLERPQLDDRVVLKAAARLLASYWDGTIGSTSGVPVGALSDSQTSIYMLLLQDAEKFVIAHELGHIVLRLTGGDIQELGWIRNYTEHGMALAGSEVEAFQTELAADLVALDIMLHQTGDSGGFGRSLTLSACELVFIVRSMLDSYRSEESRSKTHPSAANRRRSLRTAILTDPATADHSLQFGEAFQSLADNLLFGVWRAAAEDGDVAAMCRLAECYEHGRGIPTDTKKARKLYRRAARLGES